MQRETYKGRKLAARNDPREPGRFQVTCNGELVNFGLGRDLGAALAQTRRDIDLVDSKPVNGNRWGAHWYAPGTYELCPEGTHPQEIGGLCRHSWCEADRYRRANNLPRH